MPRDQFQERTSPSTRGSRDDRHHGEVIRTLKVVDGW
jgi:hypothetical protein